MNIEVENHGGSTETRKNKEPKKGLMRKVLERVGSWLSYTNKHEWLKEMRGNMGIMATFIATITFQIALNPPGGVRSIKDDANSPGFNNAYSNPPAASPPIDTDDFEGVLSCKVQGYDIASLCPGEAILAVKYPSKYFDFLLWNTICFIASLSVCLLLVTGIRLSHRFTMWLLSMGMCLVLISLALTYQMGVSMVTPDPIWGLSEFLLTTLLNTLIILVAFFALLLTLRIIIWGVKDFLKKGKRATTAREIPPAGLI